MLKNLYKISIRTKSLKEGDSLLFLYCGLHEVLGRDVKVDEGTPNLRSEALSATELIGYLQW